MYVGDYFPGHVGWGGASAGYSWGSASRQSGSNGDLERKEFPHIYGHFGHLSDTALLYFAEYCVNVGWMFL